MPVTQKYELLDYLRADKQQQFSLAEKRKLLRPVVQASLDKLTLTGWFEVTSAYNLLFLAELEGLLVDEDQYLAKVKQGLVDVLAKPEDWATLASSISVQFAHFLEEVPQATYIRLHRKMVQRTQKNDKGNTHLRSGAFAAIAGSQPKRG
jgi:hypothetical protein